MRYKPEHKHRAHKRIVTTAGELFRREGLSGVSIADLMEGLRLTNGGFYRHFGSKESLAIEAIEAALEQMGQRMDEVARLMPGPPAAAIINAYLRDMHAEDTMTGCVLAALGADIARLPTAARNRVTRATRAYVARLAVHFPGRTRRDREQYCALVLSGMSGVLNLARMTTDQAARRNFLAAARRSYVRSLAGAR